MTWGFTEFYNWAEDHLTLDLHSYKEKQLQRRINTIMNRSGAASLKEYSQLLLTEEEVLEDFLDYITINVTDFFRNENLFNKFEDVLINDLVPKFEQVRIWSAACSIGSEPYSLGIIMKNNQLPLADKIIASDIDEKILERATAGIYSEAELKNLSAKNKAKYFTKVKDKYQIHSSIQEMVDFKRHDLLLDPYPKNLHAIVCRNVMIYFKEEAKDEIYRKFSDSLETGGVIFTGATESIHQPEQFGLEKVGAFIYQKV